MTQWLLGGICVFCFCDSGIKSVKDSVLQRRNILSRRHRKGSIEQQDIAASWVIWIHFVVGSMPEYKTPLWNRSKLWISRRRQGCCHMMGAERKMCGTPFDIPLPNCDFEMQAHAATLVQKEFGYQGSHLSWEGLVSPNRHQARWS